MAFSKSFPRTLKGSSYPVWEEVSLTVEEEQEQEKHCKEDNLMLMKECLDDAKQVIREKGLEGSDVARLTIALFEKRASHAIFYKESKAKEKFDSMFKD